MTIDPLAKLSPELFGPPDPDVAVHLQDFERLVGATIPPVCRAILLHYKGPIDFENAEFVPLERSPWGGPDGKQALDFLYGVSGDKLSLQRSWKVYRGRIPDCMLPIGEAPFDNLILLGIKGDLTGKVFFWDHEDEREITGDPQSDFGNMYLIANTMSEFIERLNTAPPDNMDEPNHIAGR